MHATSQRYVTARGRAAALLAKDKTRKTAKQEQKQRSGHVEATGHVTASKPADEALDMDLDLVQAGMEAAVQMVQKAVETTGGGVIMSILDLKAYCLASRATLDDGFKDDSTQSSLVALVRSFGEPADGDLVTGYANTISRLELNFSSGIGYSLVDTLNRHVLRGEEVVGLTPMDTIAGTRGSGRCVAHLTRDLIIAVTVCSTQPRLAGWSCLSSPCCISSRRTTLIITLIRFTFRHEAVGLEAAATLTLDPSNPDPNLEAAANSTLDPAPAVLTLRMYLECTSGRAPPNWP